VYNKIEYLKKLPTKKKQRERKDANIGLLVFYLKNKEKNGVQL